MTQSNKSTYLSWWLEGLTLLVPDQIKRLFSTKKPTLFIRLQEHNLRIDGIKAKNNPPEQDHFNLQDPVEKKRLSKLIGAGKEKKYQLIYSLPTNKGLKKIVTLPINAEAELASILNFEIDRQTPFTNTQVYHGYQLLDRNLSAETLKVELNVVPKKNIDTVLSELNSKNITPDSVELETAEKTTGINILPAIEQQEKSSTRIFNMALACLCLLLFAAVVTVPFIKINQAIEATELAIAKERKGALKVNDLKLQWKKEQDKKSFENKKLNSRIPVTETLYEATTLLPDDTSLTRLYIRNEKLRLQGESSSATRLIGLLDASDKFTGTRFHSPVTNNVTTGNDRFQITTELVNLKQ